MTGKVRIMATVNQLRSEGVEDDAIYVDLLVTAIHVAESTYDTEQLKRLLEMALTHFWWLTSLRSNDRTRRGLAVFEAMQQGQGGGATDGEE